MAASLNTSLLFHRRPGALAEGGDQVLCKYSFLRDTSADLQANGASFDFPGPPSGGWKARDEFLLGDRQGGALAVLTDEFADLAYSLGVPQSPDTATFP